MLTYSRLSNWITDQIYKTVPGVEASKREEIEYGAYMLLSEVSKISLLLIVAAILHVFWYITAIISVFGFLRMSLGGIHAKTHLACIISYFVFSFGILFLSITWTHSRPVLAGITIPFSFIVAYFYAPADMPVKPVASKKQRKRLRIQGFTLLAVLFGLAMFVGQVWFNIIMLTCLLASVLMTPPVYRLTKNKYSWEEV